MAWRGNRAHECARQEREEAETAAYLARLRAPRNADQLRDADQSRDADRLRNADRPASAPARQPDLLDADGAADVPYRPAERVRSPGRLIDLTPNGGPEPAGPSGDGDEIDLRDRGEAAGPLSGREREACNDLDSRLSRMLQEVRRSATEVTGPEPMQRYAAWFRERQEALSAPPADRVAVEPDHDTTRTHDTSRRHDLARTHDTSRRHPDGPRDSPPLSRTSPAAPRVAYVPSTATGTTTVPVLPRRAPEPATPPATKAATVRAAATATGAWAVRRRDSERVREQGGATSGAAATGGGTPGAETTKGRPVVADAPTTTGFAIGAPVAGTKRSARSNPAPVTEPASSTSAPATAPAALVARAAPIARRAATTPWAPATAAAPATCLPRSPTLGDRVEDTSRAPGGAHRTDGGPEPAGRSLPQPVARRQRTALEESDARLAAVVLAVALVLLLSSGAGAFLRSRDGSTDPAGRSGSPPAGTSGAAVGAQLSAALAWVAEHAADGTLVVVPAGADIPAGAAVRTITYADAAQAPSTGLLVLAADPPLTVTALAADSEPIAVFGSGATAVRVVDLAAWPTDLAARADVGRELVSNPAVTIDQGSRTALLAGAVDPRLLVLLGQVAARHDITVSLPADPGPYQSVRLMARITSYDGAAPRRSGSAAQELVRSLRAQPRPFGADEVRRTSRAVEVEVRAPVEPGLLELGTFPTVHPASS